jgi:hypothetical protein
MTTVAGSQGRRPTSSAFLLALAVLWVPVARHSAQSIDISPSNGAVRVRASGLNLLDAESLVRLKDGRSVRVDLDLGVLPAAGATAVARTRRTFVVSYDLWEERFAVTQAGEPSQSISHVTSTAAEAWCLSQLAVPVSAIGRLAGDVPFWIRLEYRVLNVERAPSSNSDEGFTLRALIDALSRRRQADQAVRAIEAGPFRLRK